MIYTDEQIEAYLKGIFLGRIDTYNLPEDLYLATARYLEEALYKGYGGTLAEFGGKDLELLKELKDNIWMFSAAKTYSQVRDAQEILEDLSNKISESPTFNDFKKAVMPSYEDYNVNWLESEYNTAKAQASNAIAWQNIQKEKELFPWVVYSAVEDENTSEICLELNGLTLPVDDPMWDTCAPENHFNCRCILEQIDKDEDVNVTPQDEVDDIKSFVDEIQQPEFAMNPGKDGYIFSDKHSYFEVAKGDKELARNNFGLPLSGEDE